MLDVSISLLRIMEMIEGSPLANSKPSLSLVAALPAIDCHGLDVLLAVANFSPFDLSNRIILDTQA
jgi:hypothetical protein